MPSVKCSFIDHVAWEQAPFVYSLSRTVHTWRLQLSASLHLVDELALLLSGDETERSKSYLQDSDRQRFILSRGTLRRLLASYTGTPAADIRFSVSEGNKPYLQSSDTNVYFNVSHAGDWVLIAVSDHEAGADMELLNPEIDYTEILPVCFCKSESNAIQGSADGRKQFYQYWTRKEALVKATGKGVDNDLPFVPCMDGPHQALPDMIGSEKDWAVASFDIAADYTGAIAHNVIIREHRFFEVMPAS